MLGCLTLCCYNIRKGFPESTISLTYHTAAYIGGQQSTALCKLLQESLLI